MPSYSSDAGPFVALVNTRPYYSAISTSSSGDTVIVSAKEGCLIRVVRWGLICSAATVITWKSDSSGALTGPRSFADHGGLETPFTPIGIFETAENEALVINNSLPVSIGGELTYILVKVK
jgi:hypothetical protein